MIIPVVVGKILVGTSRILPTVITHLVGLHILRKKHFRRHVHVLHPLKGQVHVNVLVVDHPEYLVDFCLDELRQVRVADPRLAKVVNLYLEFASVVHLDLDPRDKG
jgi:hypothetical protein